MAVKKRSGLGLLPKLLIGTLIPIFLDLGRGDVHGILRIAEEIYKVKIAERSIFSKRMDSL